MPAEYTQHCHGYVCLCVCVFDKRFCLLRAGKTFFHIKPGTALRMMLPAENRLSFWV